jgi:D-inositol-3-phosphate glycosyltransferase
MLSMHTSPLAQPGTGDGGGMNVYVRELSSALARSGVVCEVFTRASSTTQPATVSVEPGFRVHHVPAGPLAPVPKEQLVELVGEWTDNVADRLSGLQPVELIHANYWLSGLAGHRLKHELDRPLVSTFHTLDRVKAQASPEELDASEPVRRAQAEAEIIGCSDAVMASCSVEADQLIELYGADPARIEIVAPGVDHAFFAPGDQGQARRAIGFPVGVPMVLFVGRIQPLKGPSVAVAALAQMIEMAGRGGWFRSGEAHLVFVGGPSGPRGGEEEAKVSDLIRVNNLDGRVHFVPPQRHEMLSTYYRAADVVVVPSRSESFGLVALEASACGIPVVASAVGGLSTLVDDGTSGFLVDDDDPGAFAKQLATLLDDPGLAKEMGRCGAVRAQSYTWSIAAGRLRRLYGDLCARQLVECR